jgi:plastocyanin
MRFLSVRRFIQGAAGAALLVLALPAIHGVAAQNPGGPVGAVRWLVANAKSHTATLTLIAAYNNAVYGYNFDGYGNGKMIVTIPVNYRVTVIFTNKGTLPHSAVITDYSKRNASSVSPAFRGAASTNPTAGIGKGKTERFSFIVSKVGTYAIVCTVPGHEAAGMWDVLRVTNGGSASVTFK